MAMHYDRAREDPGNIVLLEHVDLTIPDQRLATIFYISGLGLTRDPCLTIEHEVRSLTHPLYARPLVNRSPEQTNRDYARGHDSLRGAY